MDEQKRTIEAIKKRHEYGYYVSTTDDLGFDHDIEDVQALVDVEYLLAHIEAQQVVIDAALAYRDYGGRENMGALFEALDKLGVGDD